MVKIYEYIQVLNEVNMIFRIDDVSVNTDLNKLNVIISRITEKYPEAKIWLGVSMIVSDMSRSEGLDTECVFPPIWTAHSDHSIFFNSDLVGLPDLTRIDQIKRCTIVSHGLVHVDHRLLSRDAQELSIVTSANILKSDVFIPPFNKWNKDTLDICNTRKIRLVKFEDGWRHLLYNKSDASELMYFHTHDFTLEQFIEKFCKCE